nr:hypothetical protein Iba_chr03cCG5770 [Ipomoea batatas]
MLWRCLAELIFLAVLVFGTSSGSGPVALTNIVSLLFLSPVKPRPNLLVHCLPVCRISSGVDVVRASCKSFSLGLFSAFVLAIRSGRSRMLGLVGGAGSDDDFVDPPSEFVGRPRNYKEEQREASPELELTLEEDGMFQLFKLEDLLKYCTMLSSL